LRDLSQVPASSQAQLSLRDVHEALDQVTACTGTGSKTQRHQLLAARFGRATEVEQQFLLGLLLGELRQGALQGLLLDAVAQVTAVPTTGLRRALLLSGDLTLVAAKALSEGELGLNQFRLQVFRPLAPMLAQPAEALRALLEV